MTVAQRITDYWPASERELLEKEPEYSGAKDRSITDAIRGVYRDLAPAGTDVPTVSELDALNAPDLEQYVAAAATLRLLPLARAYFQQGTLSKSTAIDHGGGSGSESLYNKLDELTELRDTLRDDATTYAPLAGAYLKPPVVTPTHDRGNVPTVRRANGLIVDPLEWARQH